MARPGVNVEIREEPTSSLDAYATVSIAFRVRTELRVERADRGGIVLVEHPVDPPWIKDYDADAGEGPTRWAARWDLANWGVLAARDGPRRIGGAVIAWKTPGVQMLEERDDLAVVWDLRVAPQARGRGIGTRLFEAAAGWARARGCRELRVETQNVNVPACRFYETRGCTLASIARGAYPTLPDEVKLVWALPLGTSADS